MRQDGPGGWEGLWAEESRRHGVGSGAGRSGQRLLLRGTVGYRRHAAPVGYRFAGVRPAAVVRCADPPDVAAAVGFASRAGLPTAIRSGGHDFAGRSVTTGVVIDVGPMRDRELAEGRVRVGAGVRIGELADVLDPIGRVVPTGCGSTVGIAGLTLGGGLGVLGRQHGLTCDHLVEAAVVLADGSAVRCDDQRDPDLFWALRGGGAIGPAVVTGLTFRTTVAPEAATVFRLRWEADQAVEVLDHWQHWAPDAPEEVAASLLMTAGKDPLDPPVVTVFGSTTTTGPATAAVLAALAALGTTAPEQWSRELAWPDVKPALAALGPGDDHGALVSHSEFVDRSIPRATLVELVELFSTGRRRGEARELDFTPWGGAYGAPSEDAGAFVHRSPRFLLKHTAIVGPPEVAEVTRPGTARLDTIGSDWADRSWRLVRPVGTGGVYANFPDDDLDDPERAYFGRHAERLRRIKTAYDPDGLLPGVRARHRSPGSSGDDSGG